MTKGVVAYRLRKVRGTLVLEELGRTMRGTRYLKSSQALFIEDPGDPLFKENLDGAMKALTAAPVN